MSIYKSDRNFTLYDYDVSHGQILFRSAKSGSHSHNIDVIFWGVKYMALGVFLAGVTIDEEDRHSEFFEENSQIINHINSGTGKVYSLLVKGEKYYIVAADVRVYENELEFGETSLGVLAYKGRENELTGRK